MYSQFNNLEDVNIVLSALKLMGFDDVVEVSAAAEIVSEATRQYLSEHQDQIPIISTACPSVVRLIRVRFPNLIPHLLPLNPPIEVAAEIAAKKAQKDTGLPREKIGIFFISPCPSKVTYVKSPLGTEKSQVDHVLAIKEVYPQLLSHMKAVEMNPEELTASGKIGISWGRSGGEASERDCVYYLRENLHKLSQEVAVLADDLAGQERANEDGRINALKEYIQMISEEMAILDSKVKDKNVEAEEL